MFLKMITFAAASAGLFARDRSNEPVHVFAGGTSLWLIRWVSDRKIYWYENISPTACIFFPFNHIRFCAKAQRHDLAYLPN